MDLSIGGARPLSTWRNQWAKSAGMRSRYLPDSASTSGAISSIAWPGIA
jgi:hypothetical protein